MQTETITQVKKFKLEFEKFDDWVYIKCSDRKSSPYLLPRKYFDKMEAKHAKGKVPYNWLLKLSWVDTYVALSEDYLKQYFETGYWNPDSNTWIVDPLPLLRAGVKDRYYQADVVMHGFLHLNGKPVRRPFLFDFHDYYPKSEVIKKLRKNPKVLSVELKLVPSRDSYLRDEMQYIHIIYLPSVREFNRLVTEGKIDSCSAEWDIKQRLDIEKFQKGNC